MAVPAIGRTRPLPLNWRFHNHTRKATGHDCIEPMRTPGPYVYVLPRPRRATCTSAERARRLFNWLFARKNRGTMILRIEDTDAERNKPELVQGIVDGLQWLGVDWDEGPFYQSQRTQLYQDAAQKLLANGSAFLCYCPPERYAGGIMPKKARRNRKSVASFAAPAAMANRLPD